MTEPLFNPELGERLREEALDRVEAAAPVDWNRLALRIVHHIAVRRKFFTSDNIWEALDGRQPPEPRALGAVMRVATNRGWIEKTDRTLLSKRPECHRRPIAIWRSKIWDGWE